VQTNNNSSLSSKEEKTDIESNLMNLLEETVPMEEQEHSKPNSLFQLYWNNRKKTTKVVEFDGYHNNNNNNNNTNND
jgi:hypothetical protein